MAINRDFITRYGVVVQGTTAVTSSTAQTNSLQVNGGAAIAKNLIVGTTADIYGPIIARDSVSIFGPTQINNVFTVTNAATFQSNVGVGGNLNVTGVSTLSNTNFTGTATFNSGLTANGTSVFNGPVTFNGGGTVGLGTSSLSLNGDLTVGGIGTFNSSTAAAAGGIGALTVPNGGVYVGKNLFIAGTNADTGTNTSNALYLAGGAWIDKTLVVEGDATFKGAVTFSGTTTYVFSTNTVYTDNILNLHTPPGGVGGAWTVDDGKDIGFVFHNYKGADNDSFLGWANDTGYLEWYSEGLETVGGTFTNGVYGIFKTGGIRLVNTETATSLTSGALQVAGGIGAKNLWTTNNVSGGTVTARNLTQGRIIFAGAGGQLTDDAELTYDAIANLISGDITRATTSTNIAGGGPGMIPYQSAFGITAFVATGTNGYVLQSNATGAPTWTPLSGVVAGNATTATNVAGGTANQLVFQTAPGVTGFVGPGTAGQLLRSNGAGSPPTYVNTGNVYVGNSIYSDNLIGPANGIPYQSATDTTEFITPGTVGTLLQSNGTTATFVSTSSIMVALADKASMADRWTTARTLTLTGDAVGSVTFNGSTNFVLTATIVASGASSTATNLAGGTTGAVPYQTGPGATTFLNLSGTENALLAAGTTAPKYVTQVEAKSGTGSATASSGQSLRVTSGGLGVSGDSYFIDSVGIGANLTINGNTNSTSTTSGALQIVGGVGIGQDLRVGGTIYGNISGTLSGNAATVSTVQQENTVTHYLTFVDSNNSSATGENVYTTSSFAINPGLGHVNIGGTPRSTWDPDRSRGLHISTRQAVGYRQHAGSLYTVLETDELFLSRNVVFTTTGHQYANSNAWATLYQQGSSGFHAWFNSDQNISGPGVALAANQMMTLASNGNLGIGNTNPTARLEVTGGVKVSGITTVTNTTTAISTTTGALVVSGGAGFGRDVYVGGKVTVNDTTDSNATTQGSIVTAGGLGVAKDVVVGGDITVGVTTSSQVVPAIYSNNVILASYTSPAITNTNSVNLDQYSQTAYRTARYTVQVVDSGLGRIHITEIVVTHDGTNAYINEYGIVTSNGELGTFQATADGTNVTLTYTPTSVGSTVIKVVRFGITA